MAHEAPQTGSPRCSRCGEELYGEDNSLPCRLVALFLLLVAGALGVFGTRGAPLREAGITAALLLALWLVPRRIQWRCPSCGMTCKRRLPPRGRTPEARESRNPDGGKLP
jgi:hypothetical protein